MAVGKAAAPMDQQTKLRVLISHSAPCALAGLVSSLQGVPECEVRVWDDDLQRQYGSVHAVEADVVVSDLDQGVRVLMDCIECRTSDRTSGPKVLVVTTDERDSSGSFTTPQSAARSPSAQRREQELIDVFRKLARLMRDVESHPRVCTRGGMAPGSLRRIREHIERQISARVSLGELAEIAGLSAGHFSRAFSQSVGMPPHRYLRHRRIEAAAELIRDTDGSLAEIATSVGFADQSHLTRVFVRARGETPAAFRRRHR
jgi:AraC-like DNA-binding protein